MYQSLHFCGKDCNIGFKCLEFNTFLQVDHLCHDKSNPNENPYASRSGGYWASLWRFCSEQFETNNAVHLSLKSMCIV